jgi:hypothetical protein
MDRNSRPKGIEIYRQYLGLKHIYAGNNANIFVSSNHKQSSRLTMQMYL